jgi:hypothetical protein
VTVRRLPLDEAVARVDKRLSTASAFGHQAEPVRLADEAE